MGAFLRGQGVWGRESFFGPAAGVFSAPFEKTAMFLTAPYIRNPAALSGLSDEHRQPKSLETSAACGGVQPRWRNSGYMEQLETPRF